MSFREAWSYWKTILIEAAKGAISHARQKILLGFTLSVIAFLIQYGLHVRNWTDTQKIAASLLGAALLVMLGSFLKHLLSGPPSQQAAYKDTVSQLHEQIGDAAATDRQIRSENFKLNDRINELQTAALRQNCAATAELERLSSLAGSLRVQLEAEQAKNAKPEIRGKVTDLHHTGATTESQSYGGLNAASRVEFNAYVCNIRPIKTTLRSVIIDGSDLTPPADVVLDVQVLNVELPGEPILLEQGIGKRFHVSTDLRFQGQHDHQIRDADLSRLKVYVVDAFGDPHLLANT